MRKSAHNVFDDASASFFDLAVMVNNVAKLFGYDSREIVNALSNLQSLRSECERYERQVQQERKEYYNLQNLRSSLKEDVDSCNQTLAVYAKLFDIGFGLKELKLLWHNINEIAYANNIPGEDAVKKFFKDVEDHYDDKLGFESKVSIKQEELNNLDQKKNKLLTEINVIPQLAFALGKLLSIDGNNSIEKIKLLVEQIRKAGGISEATDRLANQSTISDRNSSVSLSDESIDNNNIKNNNEGSERKTCNAEEIKNALAYRKDDKDSNYNEYPDKYSVTVTDMYLAGNAALPRGEEKEEKPKTRIGLEEKEIEEFIESFKVYHESP